MTTTKRKPPTAPALRFSASALATLERRIGSLDKALRDALARKPNQALQDLVDAVKACAYQIKAQRAELDQLALQLEANTTAVARLVGTVPTLSVGSLPAKVVEMVARDVDIVGEAFVMFRRGQDPCRVAPDGVVLSTALSQQRPLKTV